MSYYSELVESRKLMEWFSDTVTGCGSVLLTLSDEDLGYNLFEEGHVDDAVFGFNQRELAELKDKWLISEDVYEKSVMLGNKIRELMDTEKWCYESVRNDKEWWDIMALADEIKILMDDNK